jgi:hypothetical protein
MRACAAVVLANSVCFDTGCDFDERGRQSLLYLQPLGPNALKTGGNAWTELGSPRPQGVDLCSCQRVVSHSGDIFGD